MATDLENLRARRSTIYAELAALNSQKIGGNANTSGAGTNPDHVGYKDGLYRELKELAEQEKLLIALSDDAFEVTSEACV